jgi:hypothetical protein
MLRYIQEMYSAPLSLSRSTFSSSPIPNINEAFPSLEASFPDIPNFEYRETTRHESEHTVASRVFKQCDPGARWRVADGYSSAVTVSVPRDMSHEYWRRTAQTARRNPLDADGYMYLFEWDMKDKDKVGVETFRVTRWGSTEILAKLHVLTRAVDIIRHIRQRSPQVEFGGYWTRVNATICSDENTSPILSSCPVVNLGAYLHNEWLTNAKHYFALSPPSAAIQTLTDLINSHPASTPSVFDLLSYYKVCLSRTVYFRVNL